MPYYVSYFLTITGHKKGKTAYIRGIHKTKTIKDKNPVYCKIYTKENEKQFKKDLINRKVIHIVKEKTTKNQPYTRFYTHYPPKNKLFREKNIVNLRMYVLCKMLEVSHF